MSQREFFQPLEMRRLLAGGSGLLGSSDFVSLTGRATLVIRGTDSGDLIAVTLGKGVVRVSLSPRPGGSDGASILPNSGFFTTFAARNVKRILVEANAGSDRVGIARDIGRPCTLAGGQGNDTLAGSIGDTLIGGGGNDKLIIQHEAAALDNGSIQLTTSTEGSAVLSGGNGDDTLVASGEDTLLGGDGIDIGIYQRFVLSSAPTDDTPPDTFAQNAFDDRVGNIEVFDTLTTSISTGGVIGSS